MSKHSLESARIAHDMYFKYQASREEQMVTQQQKSTALNLQQTQLVAQLATGQHQLAMQKAVRDMEVLKQKLARLTSDRKWLVVQAEHDGVIYYGRSIEGKWPHIATRAAQLIPGAKIKPRTVLMTVVQQNIRQIVAKLPEKNLSQAKPGTQATVSPTGMPDQELSAVVDTVSSIPISDGKFRAELRLVGANETKDLVAGMTCKIKLEVYRKKDALMLPKTAVGTDAWDDSRYVILLDEEGVQERHTVKVGKTSGDLIEILDGLTEGSTVLKKVDDEKADDKSDKEGADEEEDEEDE